MIGWLLKKILATTLSRWVTLGVVTTLLSSAVLWWYNYKQDLREEGIQECVQEINQETMDALEDALAAAESANAALRANLIAAARVNQEATERRREAEASLRTIEAQMRTQRETDETYREWSDSALPDGVADRLRQAAGSASSNNN